MTENSTTAASSIDAASGSANDSGERFASSSAADFSERPQELNEKLTEILARVEAIERVIVEQRPESALPSSGVREAEELASLVRQLFEMQQQTLATKLSEQVAAEFAVHQACLGELQKELRAAREPPPRKEPPPASGSGHQKWQSVVFGTALLDDPSLKQRVVELCDRILAGDAAAAVLAGQLLIFQNSAPDRRPQLLKEVGEAYYRCCPKSDDRDDDFEQALARWLERACDQAGFQNSIELVRTGQRFDSTRHMSDDRGGVEITRVHGWVVMRGRDKVYTKASVSAR